MLAVLPICFVNLWTNLFIFFISFFSHFFILTNQLSKKLLLEKPLTVLICDLGGKYILIIFR